jgi:exopolysaccharide production protein ExoZ
MKIHSIQCLRAFAAILVVYHHSLNLEAAYGRSYQQSFYHLHNFAAIGVDVFFVISGFIISYIGSEMMGKSLAREFLTKRFVRVNPIYYLFSFLTFCVYLPRKTYHFSIVESIKTIVILPIEISKSFIWPILNVGWTLSFEWYFYIMFSLLIFANIRFKEWLMFSMIVLLVLLNLVVSREFSVTRFVTNPILLEFGFGILIGWLYKKGSVSPVLACSSLIISILWFASLIYWGFGNIEGGGPVVDGCLALRRVLLWGIPSAFLVFGCLFLEKNKYVAAFWKLNILQILGAASYSIYLVHTMLFLLIDSIFKRIGHYYLDFMALIQLFIGVAAGIFCHYYIEKPIVKFFTAYVKPKSLKFNS